MSEFSFRWLHLSDLHFGMRGQAPQWSNLKHHLYDDLDLLFEQSGPWDIVIFSGDIVQRGAAEEFVGAAGVLSELYSKFRSLGCSPKFIAVPGNHDLVRPAKNDMPAMLLKDWQKNQTVREEFLSRSSSAYRETVKRAFENYEAWFEVLEESGIPLLEVGSGLLPGDQMGRVLIGEKQVGIVGLNSTWLQLTDDVAAGDIHIDHMQLSTMLPEAEEWCRSNDFNILVTHHPVNWLTTSNQEDWKREIAPPGRFDVHLHGHMHEPLSSSLSIMGASPVATFQSASLFGTEFLADKTTKRINGYSAGALSVTAKGRELRIWPRTYRVTRSGQGKMTPDQDFHLFDNVSSSILLPPKTVSHSKKTASPVLIENAATRAKPQIFVATTLTEPQAKLPRFRHHLLPSGPHAHVRKVEQSAACKALIRRSLWIISDWGLSSDKFVSSVLEAMSVAQRPIFRVDLSEIPVSGNDLDLEIEAKLGIKIQELSDELSREEAVLLLDDITLGERPQGALPREKGLEHLVQAMLDYCPSLIILMRTRTNPINDLYEKVEIGALDEADLKAYISAHSEGGDNLADTDVVTQLLARTGGVPDQVDRALKALKVVTLSELIASRDEDVDTATNADSQPLMRVIDELGNTSQTALKRAFQMLQALATFPHGAQFEHIKRFNGVHGFYTDNATELMQRGLISASTLTGLDQTSPVETRRILSVPRTVRDVIRSQMSNSSLDRHDRRAAELYFGLNWRAGSTSWPPERKYSSPKCSHHEIANASAILIRLLRNAMQKGNAEDTTSLIHLAATYSEALISGSHYHSTASFCSAFLHTAPVESADEVIARVKLNYAKALRMVGERERAIEIMENLDSSYLDRSDRESLLLTLALAYEANDDERAHEVAQKLLKTAKTPAYKVQAKSILVTSEPPSPERRMKLIALEREARNRKIFVVANNVAITLAHESVDHEEANRYLNLVIQDKNGAGNIYNEARAVVELAEGVLNSGASLQNSDHVQLIRAYQYLFIQRIPALFDRCHRALWQSFLQRGEIPNLFALFRHSSFIWRVRGLIVAEEEYITSLALLAEEEGTPGLDSRDRGYFNARLQSTVPIRTAIAE